MPNIELTSKFCDTAPEPTDKDREFYWDSKLPGFALVVHKGGHKSFVVQYRINGQSRRMSIAGTKFAVAKKKAEQLLGQVHNGGDPLGEKRAERAARADTLQSIVEGQYLTHKSVAGQRSLTAKQSIFSRNIFPALGAKPITEIKRSHVVTLLDDIEATKGHGAAEVAHKALRAFFAWYTLRSDNFVNPVVRGLYKPTQGEGARALTDDEIRIIWNVTGEGKNPYDYFVRFSLLTATRLLEAVNMTRAELSADGSEWTIPASRYKTDIDHLVPLSGKAREVLAAVPQFKVSSPDSWVFTVNGAGPIRGFVSYKAQLDKRLFAALAAEGSDTLARIVHDLNERYPGRGYTPFDKRFTTHSLRKTCKTLFDRIGVEHRVSELCLGHIEGGLTATYGHHSFKREKLAAFERLAREIDRIVTGEQAKVVALRA